MCSSLSPKCKYKKYCNIHFAKKNIYVLPKRTCFTNNREIPSNPRRGMILDGFVSCFYILRLQNNVYKKVLCFLDEQNVKIAYGVISKAFPDERIFICDEMIEKKFFSFWEHARIHIKSIKKVSQFLNCCT